jgi:hypothetical protein
MATKKVRAKQNPKTGSYTVRVQKSARTGKFTSGNRRSGTIRIQGKNGKVE